MEDIVRIYVLKDPITFLPRYVGQTGESLKHRLSRHMKEAKSFKGGKGRKTNKRVVWLNSLGEEPTIELLDIVPESKKLKAENTWIDWMVELGFDLVNTTYRDRSKNMSLTMKGANFSLSHRKKLSEAHKLLRGENSPNAKGLYRVDGEGNRKYYPTAREGAEDNNCSRQNIGSCIAGRRKKTGGYRWVRH